MQERKIIKQVRGKRTEDGAGVRLVRVLDNKTTTEFDPFLMLDSFDSKNPEDYIAGFPTHPHRGIETITYLIKGRIDHEDSLGNKDVIREGESQWMTAGSGILHQEMPQPSERMLGFQLWLNLPSGEKMAPPTYLSITKEMIPVLQQNGAEIRVLAGSFKEAAGVVPPHIKASIYDIMLSAGGKIQLETAPEETAFVFLIEDDAAVCGQTVAGKTAVLFGKGDTVSLAALPGQDARIIFFSAPPLGEGIAWGGPIVMNTQEELQHAFSELRAGTFIKHK